MVNEDYQADRYSYYYDWNGSYYSSFENKMYSESIRPDGTPIFAEKNGYSLSSYYWEGIQSPILDYIPIPDVLNTMDLAVIDEKVFIVGVNSTFEAERKLYIYQLIGELFEAKDSVIIDLESTVEEFAMEGINGELLIGWS